MTISDRPSAAGVFVVRDPEVCAALEQLLAPHRTEPARTAAAADEAIASRRLAQTLAELEESAARLSDIDPADLPVGVTVTGLLERVHQAGHTDGHALATSEGREWSEAMRDRVRRAEAAVAHAEREGEKATAQLREALAKIAELEARRAPAAEAPKKPRGNSPRAQDRDAFTDLARRMEEQARTQPKPRADVLRIAAGAVRDEIVKVYGTSGKKAS